MPSKSTRQANFMRIAAHSPEFAKKAGVPQSVAREFYAEDKRSGLIAKVAEDRRKKKGRK